jgi:hypothetical protein
LATAIDGMVMRSLVADATGPAEERAQIELLVTGLSRPRGELARWM